MAEKHTRKKTILANLTNGFMVRNFLYTSIPERLIEAGCHIVLAVPSERVAYYRKIFPRSELTFIPLPCETSLFERFFIYLETASIHTETVLITLESDFSRARRHKGYLRRLFHYSARKFLWRLGAYAAWRRLVRFGYAAAPGSWWQNVFREWKPDLVYCPSVMWDDIRIIKDAHRAGIPTVGMVFSWDNLYSKTFVRAEPDILLVHNDVVKEQAISLADFPEDRIVVSGVPQYDRYLARTDIKPRESFIRELGGDPEKKLIVYAFSGKLGIANDGAMLEKLAEFRDAGAFGPDVQVLVRPYPRYDFPAGQIEHLRSRGFLVEPAMSHIGGFRDDWEFDARALSLLANTLAHADVILSMYSTFFVEGAIFDRPLVGIVFDALPLVGYSDSVRRFFQMSHLAAIRRTGAIYIVRDEAELPAAVRQALAHPEIRRKERTDLVLRQLSRLDGHSGDRVADILTRSLQR